MLLGYPETPTSLNMSAAAAFLANRYGVDLTSLDVILLTDDELEDNHTWEKVSITGTQVLASLQEGLFDAFIWSRDGIQGAPPNVMFLPLQGDAHKHEIATQVALVALRDAPVYHVLTSLFSPEYTTLLQQEVMNQQRLPRY